MFIVWLEVDEWGLRKGAVSSCQGTVRDIEGTTIGNRHLNEDLDDRES